MVEVGTVTLGVSAAVVGCSKTLGAVGSSCFSNTGSLVMGLLSSSSSLSLFSLC